MTCFDVFQETPYKFLFVQRGMVKGNVVTESEEFMGIFKLRQNDATTQNMEIYQSDSTLHAHPEDIKSVVDDADSLIGQGIRVEGFGDFEISRVTSGWNYDTNEIEHFTLTLQKAEFVDGIAENND